MRPLWRRLNTVPFQRICIFCRGAEERWLRSVWARQALSGSRSHNAAALMYDPPTTISENRRDETSLKRETNTMPFHNNSSVEVRPFPHRPAPVRSKLALLAEFQKALATQDIDRIWPIYSTFYRYNYLHYLTRRNFRQLFIYTTRGRASQKNLHRLLALMDDMKMLQMPLRLSEYNVLMNWVGGRAMTRKQLHHLTNAFGLFDELGKRQIQPDVVTYNTLIHIASQVSDMRTAQRLYHDMVARGIRPDAYTYSTLIHSMGKMGDIPSIERLLVQLRENDAANNTITWNAVLASYAHNGVYDKAESMFNQMVGALPRWRRRRKEKKKPFQDTPPADVESFRTMIAMRLRHGQLTEAMEDLERMLQLDIQPMAAVYNSFFSYFMDSSKSLGEQRASHLTTLRQLYTSMQQTKTAPNSDTMYTLVSALLDLGDTKFALETFVKLSNESVKTEDLSMSGPVATLTQRRFRSARTLPARIEPNQILMDRLTSLVSQSSS
ncbi:hypothetical protein EC973_008343 [Apophysomyces ossiformis]|uniref:Uncharacterized protein n=1 Tax=Apophysomyces ossiformis TaxID=679940 RepID=A0A8H7BVF0_9FUNG|nr:hypothetical protein EC973_008343 [Apophysomyces ossiformis]